MRLTDAEWQIMNALWDSQPATARDIDERLSEDVAWAYTTIKTLLTRLLNKGAVSERKRGNTSVYEPRISRRDARRTALRALTELAFQGAFGPLLHFLVDEQELTSEQRKQLRDALDRQPRRKRGQVNDDGTK
jgi:BlaI family transcriptional regulator, penicillinase repressor